MIAIRLYVGLSSARDSGLDTCGSIRAKEERAHAVHDLAGRLWPEGYTALSGKGEWKGGGEPCIVLERLERDASTVPAVRAAVAEWASELGQEAIGMAVFPVETLEFVQPAVRERGR